MSKLLINENPLLVLPSLAKAIGLNEALFAQQLHYWLNSSMSMKKDDKPWVINTLDRWCENFPFWSKRTLQRVIESLVKNHIIEVANFNSDPKNHTRWYTLNYQQIDSIETGTFTPAKDDDGESEIRCGQNGHIDVDKMATSGRSNSDVDKMATSLSIIVETNKKRLSNTRDIETSGSAVASPVTLPETKTDPVIPATVPVTELTKADRLILEEEKKRKAFASFDAYCEYMKLSEVYEKPVAQWNPTDFVKFFYCGMAKYSPSGPTSMPIWAKDARIMQVYIKKYGCVNLNRLIVTLCQRKADVERRCNKEITLSISILAIPWIMAEVEALTFGKADEPPMSNIERIQANRAAELKAAAIRSQLKTGVQKA